jgi:hypothetical protein
MANRLLQQKTYLPKPAWLWKTLSICFLLMAIFLSTVFFLFIIKYIILDRSFKIIYITVFILSLFFIPSYLLLHYVFKTQLLLKMEGIEYSGGYYKLYTPWTNVDNICRSAKHVYIVELKQPAEINVPIVEGYQRGVAVIERSRMTFWMGPSRWLLKNSPHFIPIPPILVAPREWKTGTFRSYLDICAPEVSKKIDQKISS